jgi:hypothetical protein
LSKKVSGVVDRVVVDSNRDRVIADAKADAIQACIDRNCRGKCKYRDLDDGFELGGADASSVEIVECRDAALTYNAHNGLHIVVRAVGNLVVHHRILVRKVFTLQNCELMMVFFLHKNQSEISEQE